MYTVFKDALIDTALMIPLLLLIYIGIEVLEYKMGSKIREKVRHAGNAGPAIGAAFGCVPQCGFSVISTTLYIKKLITIGTLLAVYISTSDEAIPVILAQPSLIGVIWKLLLVKIIIAIIAGYSIDFILKRVNSRKQIEEILIEEEASTVSEEAFYNENIGTEADEKGCCGHSCSPEKPKLKELIVHPLIHTMKVFVFIFAASCIINFIIFKLGEQNLAKILLGNSIFQPMLVGLIGLIPNCATSVAITEVFLKGGISFGSAIAGLSAGAGLGMLVLFKENKNTKDSFKIIGILLLISITAGTIIQYAMG